MQHNGWCGLYRQIEWIAMELTEARLNEGIRYLKALEETAAKVVFGGATAHPPRLDPRA